MAWEFEAKCTDCGYHWNAMTWNERIGHHSEQSHCYFCPKCYVHVYISRELDRYTFQKWLAANTAAVNRSSILRDVVALIEDIANKVPGLLIPHSFYAPGLSCSHCDCALVKGNIDQFPILCIKCGSGNARSTGIHSHVSLAHVEDLPDSPDGV